MRSSSIWAVGPASRWVGSLTDFALAIADLAQSASALEFTIVVEPDAACRDLLTAILASSPNVVLREAMPYPEFLRLMEQQDIVLADSLDYYDEAIALGKPTLLAQAPISSQDLPPLTGLTFIGEQREQIVRGVLASRAPNGSAEHRYPMASPLGDGHAAARIARLVMNWSRNQILTPRAFEPFRS